MEQNPRVTRDSPSQVKDADNRIRISAAEAYLGSPDYYALGTDGTVSDDADSGNKLCAGAAVLLRGSSFISASGKRATASACSYSTERVGGDAGMQLVLELETLLAREQSAPSARLLLWFVDNRGLAATLSRGPLAQDEYVEACIWKSLLRLVALGWRIAICWVFSHCSDLPANIAADAHADVVARDDKAPLAPEWYVDAARARWTPVFAKYCAEERRYLSTIDGVNHIDMLSPQDLRVYKKLSAPRARLLACLRTGVWGVTGVTETAAPCTLCSAMVTRRAGVEHILDCPFMHDTRGALRSVPRWTPNILWDDNHAADIVSYALDYKSRCTAKSAGAAQATPAAAAT
jgi:hypothetical protein